MDSISFEKITLTNGLDLILHEDHSLPLVAVNVWYHVGSKDEEVGRTGFAHLFEHVMFEGSKHHNQNFFEPLQKVGATLNGSTTPDRTNYWESVPSNYLELALWLESDRMGFLLDALDQERFDVQREVVKNERRQSYENRPYGMAQMLLQPAVFKPPHPYSWTTIGSPQDLDAADLADVKAFFRRFYAPSNASLAIAGDFVRDDAIGLVERYFGDLPPGPSISRVGRMDSGLSGHVLLTMRDKVQLPRLYLVWPTVPLFDTDQAPLDLLSAILGDGKSSRLYRSLVYEKQVARNVAVFDHPQEIAGEFHIQVTANPGHTVDEIEAIVWDEIDRVRRESPSEKELARAKNRIESRHVLQLEQLGGFGGRADQLNYYNTFTGDPGVVNTDLDRYRSVRAEDVHRVASSALGRNHARLVVTPEAALKPSSKSIDRALAPTATPRAVFKPPTAGRARLSNGISVVHVERSRIPTVAFGLLLRAGAVTDPPDTPGLANMTTSMLPEGTARRSSLQIAEEMEFLGSQLSCATHREYVVLSAEALTSHWATALEIMADVVRNPSFPPQELERLRRERLTDLKRVGDNPVTIATRAFRGLLYGPDTAFGHPLSGVEAAVEGMCRDNLLRHFNRWYSPEDATLVVVGALTEGEVISEAEAYLGDWVTGRASTADSAAADPGPDASAPATIFLADKPGAAQSVIQAGHLTIPRHHSDYHRMNLLNYIFGGQFSARLNMNLRQDKGYSYGYMSSIDWISGPSALLAGGAVETAVTKEAVVETLKEFADIRDTNPVTSEELQDAKDGVLRGLPAQFETNAHTLHQLTRLIVFGLPDDYFDGFAESLAAVSLKDVQRVARDRIDRDHLKILVVGDLRSVEPELRELGLPIVHVDFEGRELPEE